MAGFHNDYIYDGTFEGFLCLALRCFRVRSLPHNVIVDYRVGEHIFIEGYQQINTDFDLADRFYVYIGKYTSPDVQILLSECFLTDMQGKECTMISFIHSALKHGAKIVNDYSVDAVRRVQFAVRELYRETHKFAEKGQIMFKKYNNIDIGLINPHNCIIPIIKGNILKRIELDDMMLYDQRHGILLSRLGETDLVYDVNRVDVNWKNDLYETLGYRIIPDITAWSYCREPESGKELHRFWYIAG